MDCMGRGDMNVFHGRDQAIERPLPSRLGAASQLATETQESPRSPRMRRSDRRRPKAAGFFTNPPQWPMAGRNGNRMWERGVRWYWISRSAEPRS